MNDDKVVLTKEGLLTLRSELAELKDVKRPKAVKRLAEAKAQGDLSENSEYSAAMEELAFMDGRIDELEEIVKQAKEIHITSKKKDKVEVGCQVTVDVNGSHHVFAIVGEWEADPSQKKISHSSPLGKALVGKKKGERVEVKAPVGKVTYTIVDIH